VVLELNPKNMSRPSLRMPRSQDFVEKAKLANAAAIYLTFAEYIKMEGRAFPGTSPSLYDKDFPFFRQPTILGSFSVDGKTPFVFFLSFTVLAPHERMFRSRPLLIRRSANYVSFQKCNNFPIF
jgi:hypothetical protein